MPHAQLSSVDALRVDRLSRLAGALEILARRWRREAEDPHVAPILRARFGSSIVELVAIRDLLVGRIDAAAHASSALPLDLLLRLDSTLGALAELAKETPAVNDVANKTVDIQSRFRVKRLEATTRRLLKKIASLLAAGVVGATAFAALPAAALNVGDLVTNPDTGLDETVVEVIIPELVATADHYILLATHVGDTFTDPETGSIFTVNSVTTNLGGFVTEVTAVDGSSEVKTLTVVTDINGGADTADGDAGTGADDFSFTPASGDVNNYVNSKTGKDGKDGKDGAGIRICAFGHCHTIGKKPSSGGSGAGGPDLNVTLNSPSGTPKPPNWGDIQTVTDGLAGAFISSTGGDGGQGGDAWGNISGAPGGKSGKGGNIVFSSSVKITTAGEEAFGIFAKSSAGKGGKGGKGFIAGGGGTGGSPGLAGTVTVTNTGIITTTGKGAIGILAESLGGKAGSGGGSFGIIADGGGGNVGGDGGAVIVNQAGTVHTPSASWRTGFSRNRSAVRAVMPGRPAESKPSATMARRAATAALRPSSRRPDRTPRRKAKTPSACLRSRSAVAAVMAAGR